MAQSATPPKLVGIEDPLRGQEFLCVGMLKIGRDSRTNSLAVEHPSISRQHARIFQEAGAWVVEDLKSTNGVFVNGARIAGKAPLRDGDEVKIGAVPFRFTAPAPAPAPAPARAPAPPPSFAPTIAPAGAPPPVSTPAAFAPTVQPAPAEEAAMEGMTMYGAVAQVSLGKAIQQEVPVPKAPTAPSRPAEVRPEDYSAGATLPPSPLARLFRVVLALVVLAVLGVVVFKYIRPGDKSGEALLILKKRLREFKNNQNTEATNAEFPAQIKTLEEMELGDDKQNMFAKFPNMPEESAQELKTLREEVAFLVFERKFLLALGQTDPAAARAEALRLIQEAKDKISKRHQDCLPLAELVVKFRLFLNKYREDPTRSERPPARKDVEEVGSAAQMQLEREVADRSGTLAVVGRHLKAAAKGVTDKLYSIQPWVTFWSDYDRYRGATGEEKTRLGEQLKHNCPHINPDAKWE